MSWETSIEKESKLLPHHHRAEIRIEYPVVTNNLVKDFVVGVALERKIIFTPNYSIYYFPGNLFFNLKSGESDVTFHHMEEGYREVYVNAPGKQLSVQEGHGETGEVLMARPWVEQALRDHEQGELLLDIFERKRSAREYTVPILQDARMLRLKQLPLFRQDWSG
jgi:hypothetical protein